MTDIPQAIYRWTVFGRGLPQGNGLRESPDMTAIMSEVIKKESIVCADDYLASNPDEDDTRQAALRKIFRSGWLHTEIREDIDGILYTFASPLHRWCIDWKLNGSPSESRIIEPNLFKFALAVIQRFSRESLEKREIGPKHNPSQRRNSRTNFTPHPLGTQKVLFHFQSLVRKTEGLISSSG